ncbi:Oidioi.mRNA.OKI2018_I69.chr1.g360.t1.cds [Oikopleura dioica]|uniref:Oidioi.mRNA.OKI2018_I69.chr1.g360.t1.cds n=1 Tax=Oikopleura dioica TaxID=34765 RepID=A0ABN7SP12_OIKDI|nr:Oidioi.mRNA.OKI2018_I69.chr1.g360.t1.cds [Oikopleura dioica]
MKKEYSGFDQIYTRLPEISRYQLKIFFFASFSIIFSGCVQNASVLLNAKPQNYRCRPSNPAFSSLSFKEIEKVTPSNPCRAYSAPNSSENLPQKCEICTSGFVFSPENPFTQTAVTEFNWLCEENS